MNFYIDWETGLFQAFKADTEPVALGAYCAKTKDTDILLPEEVQPWLRATWDEGNRTIGWNMAFDMLHAAVNVPGADAEWVVEVMEAYERGQIICAQKADQLTCIANGTYARRGFSLGGAYYAYTGKSIADSKGLDHPIIGATKGAKADQKSQWCYELNKWQLNPLDFTGEIPGGIPLSETPWRFKFALLRGLPLEMWPNEPQRYIVSDCIETAEVLEAVCHAAASIDYIDENGLPHLTVDESRLWFGLMLTQEVGVFTRLDYVAEMQRQAETAMAEIKPALWNEILFTDEKGKPRRVLQLRKQGAHKGTVGPDEKALQLMVLNAYEEVGLEAPKTEPSATYPQGQVQTNDKVLSETPGLLPELYRAWYENDRLATLYCPLFAKGWLHTNYTMAITGRINSGSDKENKSPVNRQVNFTNFAKKKGIRQAFRPPTEDEFRAIEKRLKLPPVKLEPGDRWIMGEADFAAAECYTGAINIIHGRTGHIGYIPGISELADDLMTGIDIPSMLGSMELREDYEYFAKNRKKIEEFGKARQRNKSVIYGALGMMWGKTLARQAFRVHGVKLAVHPNGMWDFPGSIEVGKNLLKNAFRRYPDVKWHRERFSYDFRHTGVSLPSGMRRGECYAGEAGNFCIQPEVARMTKEAIWTVWKQIYTGEIPEGTVIYTDAHDAIGWYCLERYGHEVAQIVKRAMLEAKERFCPGMVRDNHVVPVLTEVMEKDADPTYDDTGRLIVTPNSCPVPPRHEYPWDSIELSEEDEENERTKAEVWLARGQEQRKVESTDWEAEVDFDEEIPF